jgi:5-methylcytosine-specific restriction endonuclease McrA
MKPKDISKETFIEICNQQPTMAKAAAALGLHFNTFKTYAVKYGCYKPNQAGKGISKNIRKRVVNLEDYATRAGVRRVIIKDGLIPYKCGECEISEWNNKKLALHLDHINGKNSDHRLDNLRFLCPNCHSQTETYTGKNK